KHRELFQRAMLCEGLNSRMCDQVDREIFWRDFVGIAGRFRGNRNGDVVGGIDGAGGSDAGTKEPIGIRACGLKPDLRVGSTVVADVDVPGRRAGARGSVDDYRGRTKGKAVSGAGASGGVLESGLDPDFISRAERVAGKDKGKEGDCTAVHGRNRRLNGLLEKNGRHRSPPGMLEDITSRWFGLPAGWRKFLTAEAVGRYPRR